MGSLRKLIAYFTGWPGLAALSIIGSAIGLYLENKGFTAVTERTAIHQLLAGHTLKAEGYRFYYAGDGRAVGEVIKNVDVGRWEAFDNVYCEQWQVWGGGIRRCWALETDGDRVKRTGTGFPFNENDPTVNELQRVEGNQVNAQ